MISVRALGQWLNNEGKVELPQQLTDMDGEELPQNFTVQLWRAVDLYIEDEDMGLGEVVRNRTWVETQEM